MLVIKLINFTFFPLRIFLVFCICFTSSFHYHYRYHYRFRFRFRFCFRFRFRFHFEVWLILTKSFPKEFFENYLQLNTAGYQKWSYHLAPMLKPGGVIASSVCYHFFDSFIFHFLFLYYALVFSICLFLPSIYLHI